MGSPLSLVVYRKTMESSYKLKVSLRYVDDTVIIWPYDRDSFQTFYEHLNGQHSDFQFTMEVKNNSSLSFLDVLVTFLLLGNCCLDHSVYSK